MEISAYTIDMEKLNLHRVRHEDVKRKVIHFIEDNWASNEEVEIVTGNSIKMKFLVTEVLDEYNLAYTVGRPFDYCKGYLVIMLD